MPSTTGVCTSSSTFRVELPLRGAAKTLATPAVLAGSEILLGSNNGEWSHLVIIKPWNSHPRITLWTRDLMKFS